MTEDRERLERRIANLRSVAQNEARRSRGESATEEPVRPEPAAPSSDERPGDERSGSKRPGQQRHGLRKRLAALGPLGLLLAFVLGKAKLVVPLLKFAKMGTLVSMFVAVWAYALLWGYPFAIGFVLLIFVHELGHALVMRHLGIHAGAPVFIPFVGAVIAMKSLPRNAFIEALVGIGGPVLGSVGALVCLLVAWATGSLFSYALASTGFLINLFNMIPISPLDGGRIVGAISRWVWVVGYAIGITMFFVTRSPLLFLVLLVGLLSLVSTIRGPKPGYYDIAPEKRWGIGIAYFGLIGLLSLGMQAADGPLEGVRGGRTAVAVAGSAEHPATTAITEVRDP